MRAIAIFLLLLASCGKTPVGSPLDGIWTLSGVTCGGQPGITVVGGAAANMSNGNTQTYTITGTTGTIVVSNQNCTVTFTTAVSYPGGNLMNLTLNGTEQCVPSACGGDRCGNAASGTAEYTFDWIGLDTFSLTSIGNSDQLCTAGEPPQANPVELVLTR